MIMENNNVNKTYGLALQAVHTENGQDLVIQNQNHFRINEIVVTVTSTVSTITDTPVTDNATASDCVCVQKSTITLLRWKQERSGIQKMQKKGGRMECPDCLQLLGRNWNFALCRFGRGL